jgi:peptidoglycan-associated lipoprotein
MNPRRFLAIALAALCPLLLASCGGKKRGPAVATGADATGSGTSDTGGQAVDEGSGIRTVDADSAEGADFAVSDPDGQGGPLEDIHFALDQSDLTDQARATLERNSQWMRSHAAAKVRVEGHCDERGTVEYNLALGERRARVAFDYLASLGVAADRMKSVSYGKEIPVCQQSNEDCWSRNRRDHFAVTGKAR